MGQMVGADIAELRELAASFKSKAATLRTMEANLNNRIHSAPWTGHDVNNFIHTWNSTYRPSMERAATFVQSASEELLANALQQEQASEAGYIGSVGSVAAFRVTLRTDTVCTLPAPSWLSLLGGAARNGLDTLDNVVGWEKKLVGTSAKALRVGNAIDIYRRAGDILTSRSLLSVIRAEDELLKSGKAVGTLAETYSVLSSTGKALGLVSAGVDAAQFKVAVHDGDKYGMFKHGVSAVLGAGSVVGGPAVPVFAGLGLAFSLGTSAYEHREQIGTAVGAAQDWGARTVTDVAAGVNRTVDAAQEVVTNQVNNAVAGVNRTVDAAQDVVTEHVTQVADGVGQALNSGKKLFKHFGL